MPVQGVTSAAQALINQVSSQSGGGNFADILSAALSETNETDALDKIGNMEMLSGDLNMLHTTTIEAEKAELALRLTIQIRNKVVDAYSEVMRMQV